MFIMSYTLKTILMSLYVSYSNRKILNLQKDKKIKILVLLYIIISII